MSKVKLWFLDFLKGLGIGAAVIIPGVAAGTIAIITGCYKKLIEAIKNLLKHFGKSLLILLPFVLGAICAVLGLWIPFKYAFEYCMLAIVALFAGFIIGSIPGVTDEIKDQKPTKKHIVICVIGVLISAAIGLVSYFVNLDKYISQMFEELPVYLYFILIGVGLIGSAGVVVPGISGSMLLCLIGFYKPILGLIDTLKTNPGAAIGLLGCFAVGVIVGVILLSFLMSSLLKNHKRSFYYAILGFILGSIFTIFFNSSMINYIKNRGDLKLDLILMVPLLIIGIILSYLLVRFIRKHPQIKEE